MVRFVRCSLVFVNPEVAIDSLPAAERVAWRPLDSRYLPRVLLGQAIRWAIILGVAGVAQVLLTPLAPPWLTQWPLVPLLWALLGLAALRALLWPFVSVPRCGYAVRDKDILYKTGVLWRNNQVVPFNRVQHAVNSHGPLDRYFHLATLTVNTAGGGLSVPGLAEDVAERLRVHIVAKLRAAAEAEAASLSDPSPQPAPPAGEPPA